ncbi:Mu transposase C-terminal domain-containing protein [Methylosinus sp. Sm6]|uniref:Mu transposase C-terminal domain-containing protein n=1 Tax=Methylosinus sp. Sm6 TaxID=2866948 RepID=UPI001C99ABDE|nr:Mu transposase C-terminal domain-containing protein [Methylosinus sp. Sm6]MBY6242083.1 Mu transposase C-terminal domain-containing protein [Methylosinus sp. Sm6]
MRPLEAVQIDHAQVDAIIIDEETGRALGRPWIALGIDAATRVVTGFHLTLAPPTLLSASLCFLHSVCDKSRWLAERGLAVEWPVAGLPDMLHVDADSFFGRRAFARACRNVGVETVWSAPNGRRYGAHIEALIGDRLGELRLLTDAEPIRLRENDIRAPLRLSLDALERRIGAAIASDYLRRRHADLRRAPLSTWRALSEGAQFRAPADCVAFRLDFLPQEDCALGDDGVSLLGRLFWSRALADDVEAGRRRLPVKYDPRDLSRIFVRRPSGRFVKALIANDRADALRAESRASLALAADCCGWSEERADAADSRADADEDLRDAPNAYGASATACAQKCVSSCPFQSAAR